MKILRNVATVYLKIHPGILNFPGNSGELPFGVFFLIAGEATVELWGEKGAGAEQI